MEFDLDLALDRKTITAIERCVADWLAEERVPGASLALVDADGRLYDEGFGSRDLRTNTPATARTLYGMGSVTKSVAALTISRLVEDGALSFEDSVSDYVSYYADAPGEPVTIHDLLTHTSGYPSDGSSVALIARQLDVDHTPIPLGSGDGVRRHIAGAADERDEGFFYNNAGYTVIGAVIEECTGEPFATSVREAVLDPLEMERATFSSEALAANDAMTPYRMDDGPVADAFPFDEYKHAPGGLLAPVSEMGRYLRLYLNDGTLDGVRIVTPQTIGQLTDGRTLRKTGLDGRKQRYGYGWMTEEFLGDRLVSHGGNVAVSTAWVGYLTDREIGVALACNTTPTIHPTALGMSVLALLCEEEPRAVVPAIGLREKTEAVTGTYQSYRAVATATVERCGGGLRLLLTTDLSEQEFNLVPETTDPDEYSFYTVTTSGNKLPIEFETTDNGMDLFVERWRLHRTTT